MRIPERLNADQICSIDNRRLLKKTGYLDQEKIDTIKTNFTILLDI